MKNKIEKTFENGNIAAHAQQYIQVYELNFEAF